MNPARPEERFVRVESSSAVPSTARSSANSYTELPYWIFKSESGDRRDIPYILFDEIYQLMCYSGIQVPTFTGLLPRPGTARLRMRLRVQEVPLLKVINIFFDMWRFPSRSSPSYPFEATVLFCDDRNRRPVSLKLAGLLLKFPQEG